MSHDLVRTHLRNRWLIAAAIDPSVTPDLLQAAIDEEVVEKRATAKGFGWEYRLAPHIPHAGASATLAVALTQAQADRIRGAAAREGVSVSQLLRDALEAVGLL